MIKNMHICVFLIIENGCLLHGISKKQICIIQKYMGKNIVYLPAYFEFGEIIPAGNPFLLDLNGDVEKKINWRTGEFPKHRR